MYPDDFAKKFGFYFRFGLSSYLSGQGLYDFSEFHSIGVRLLNAWKRYNECSSDYLDYDGYLLLHQKIWNLYHSDMLRLSMQNEDIPLNEKYDNLDSVKESFDSNGFLPIGFSPNMLVVVNPNDFESVKVQTRKLSESYFDNVKHRNVNNIIYSSYCEEF